MSVKYIQEIPSVEEIIKMVPMSASLKKIKKERDEEIKKIFLGESDKFLVILGPCSADRMDSVLDYVERIGKLSEKLSDKLCLIPRIYTNKPRTTGEGYKGMLHQPNPNEAPNLLEGIIKIRKLHIKAMELSGLTAADEMLYPENHAVVEDFLSYSAIGARSVENQQHRLVVSGVDVPVGMKNPTSGDFNVMLNAIQAGQSSHSFIYRNHEVMTDGNPLAHAIIRGYVNRHGNSLPNYHYEDLQFLAEEYEKRKLKNPSIIVDVNHANSGKKYYEQARIAHEVLQSRKWNSKIKKMLKGVMIESYIEEGSQGIDEGIYGKSITDPCLSYKDTEKLLYEIADLV